ncbi:MAG TPA: putative Ig domain-containing protein [Fibrobacteria bacterium]|nr:putative Ig domain-containing protein [Fibrobacteria bacterium]
MKKCTVLFFAFLSCAALFLLACTTAEEGNPILHVTIDKDNDSLLTFDSLIITVHSKDGSFSQDAFHGILRSPDQVARLVLDPRVGEGYSITLIGYKNGKIGVHKEITFIGKISKSTDVPIKPDTVMPGAPEILAPSDTSIAEGDSLRFRVTVRNPRSGSTILALKNALPGASLDTVGRDPGDGYFTWRPSFTQGRIEPYAVTFVYSAADKQVEKIVVVKVLNVNQPPKLAPISDQAVKENETLTFKVEAVDPDQDSLGFTSSALPQGAVFSSGTFTWKPATGQTGNYPVKFKVWDGKDSDMVAVLLTVGNVAVPPSLVVKITSPGRDTTVNTPAITILYTVNGIPFQKTVALKDGKTKIFIDTTALGRTGLDTVNVTLDTVPPGRPALAGQTPVRTLTPTWIWKSGGGGSGIFRYRLDGADMAAGILLADTVFTSPKDLIPGTHTLFVQERDAAGNWSPTGSFLIRIDVVPPNPPAASSDFTNLVNTSKPTWTWISGGNDGMGSYRVKVDNNDLANGAIQVNKANFKAVDSLSEGAHILYVQESDSAGNWSATSAFSLRIDLTPPSAPIFAATPLSPLNSLRPNWTWASGGGGIGVYRYKLDAADLGTGATSLQTGAFKPAANLSQGKHTLYVQERDSAGNWSAMGSREIVVSLREIVGAPGFTAGRAFHLTLGISNAGVIYMGYPNSENDAKVTVMRFNGNNWAELGNTGLLPAGDWHSSLAIGGDGYPYIAASDTALNGRATVKRYNGTNWVNVGPAGFSDSKLSYPTLAISKTGIPYIAGNGGVMRFNGSEWENLGDLGGCSLFTSINTGPAFILDKAGTPYVACFDTTTGDHVSVLRWSGNSWTLVGSNNFATTEFCSLAIGESDIPFVAFIDKAVDKKVTVMQFIKGHWEYVGSQGFSPDPSGITSIVIDQSGIPYVAFGGQGDSHGDGARGSIMRFNGTSWEIVGVPGFTENLVTISLVLDGNGVPYLLFTDMSQGGRATLMKTSFDP